MYSERRKRRLEESRHGRRCGPRGRPVAPRGAAWAPQLRLRSPEDDFRLGPKPSIPNGLCYPTSGPWRTRVRRLADLPSVHSAGGLGGLVIWRTWRSWWTRAGGLGGPGGVYLADLADSEGCRLADLADWRTWWTPGGLGNLVRHGAEVGGWWQAGRGGTYDLRANPDPYS
eukprot:gene13966-biopygen3590